MNYFLTDQTIAYLDGQLIEQFDRLRSLLAIDKINIIGEVNAMFSALDTLIRASLLQLANAVYAENCEKDVHRTLDEDWLDFILAAYDPMSKYVYYNEMDRKRARLIEALMASPDPAGEIKSTLRQMSFLCRIYAVRVTDEAALQAFRDEEETLVRWIAEKDNRTCPVCWTRDGKVYEIEFLPPKPHPNCRCYFRRLP